MNNFSMDEAKALKGRGIILGRDGRSFAARIPTRNGVLTLEQLAVLSEAARRFGNGKVALTVRMSVEIQGVPFENVEPLCAYLTENGLSPGGTGPKIRPVTACKGTVCPHGLFDTQALAGKLHEMYYIGWRDIRLPHKFKIGVGGCPNNCIKPALNDFGIMGQSVPKYDPDACRSCGKCQSQAACPCGCFQRGEDGRISCDPGKCIHCGSCLRACPFGAVSESLRGYRVLVGGLWGKRQRFADPLPGIWQEEEVLRLLEASLQLWLEQGRSGERFGFYLDRIGVDVFQSQLLERCSLTPEKP